MAMNQSEIERFLRVFIGTCVLSLVFLGPRTPWGYLGLIGIFTGLWGVCPLYTVFRFTTRRHGDPR